MHDTLSGLKIALLVTDGFEQSEMTDPRKALEDAGAQVDLISPKDDVVKGWKDDNWAKEFCVDIHLNKAKAEEYDALLLPGGVINPDKLRLEKAAIEFIKKFVDAKKPIAAICHGPWTLIDAGGIKGRSVTSWPSIAIDLKNAGAQWSDKEVVVDGNLVTSRQPEDIPAFSKAFIEILKQLKK